MKKTERVKMPEMIGGMGGPERKTQRGPWKVALARAVEEKAWADERKFDTKWLGGASRMSLEMLYDRMRKTVLELAIYHYSYWRMRAHASYGYNHGSALDPAARNDWIEAGGKMEPRE